MRETNNAAATERRTAAETVPVLDGVRATLDDLIARAPRDIERWPEMVVAVREALRAVERATVEAKGQHRPDVRFAWGKRPGKRF